MDQNSRLFSPCKEAGPADGCPWNSLSLDEAANSETIEDESLLVWSLVQGQGQESCHAQAPCPCPLRRQPSIPMKHFPSVRPATRPSLRSHPWAICVLKALPCCGSL